MCSPLARVARGTTLVLCLAASGALPSRAQDAPPQPADVLKAQGLSRPQGSTWILEDSETAILKAFKDAQALGVQLRRGEVLLREFEANPDPRVLAESLSMRASVLNQQINAINQQINAIVQSAPRRSVTPLGMRQVEAAMLINALIQQRTLLAQEVQPLTVTIINLRTQAPQVEQQKKQLSTDVEKARTSYLDAVDKLHDSVAKATSRYSELAKDELVANALADLSRAAQIEQTLGPSKEFLTVVKSLGGFATVQTETTKPGREKGADRNETPHEVLTRKGLKRSGSTYVLVDAEERQFRFNRSMQDLDGVDPALQQRPEVTERVLADARAEHQKIEKRITDLKSQTFKDYTTTETYYESEEDRKNNKSSQRKVTVTARSQEAARDQKVALEQSQLEQLKMFIAQCETALRARQNLVSLLTDSVRTYASLDTDAEVQDALKALTKENRARIVLGSVKVPENRATEFRADILERLTKKGLVPTEGRHRLVVVDQSAVIDLARQTHQLQRAVESLEKRFHAAQAAGRPPKDVQELTDRLDWQRKLLADHVRALRVLADKTESTREAIEEDQEVPIALAQLNRLRTKPGQPEWYIATLPDYQQALADLGKWERSVAKPGVTPKMAEPSK
jgi:hypothetical protein